MLLHRVRNHVEDGLGLRVANSLLDRPVLDHSSRYAGAIRSMSFSIAPRLQGGGPWTSQMHEVTE